MGHFTPHRPIILQLSWTNIQRWKKVGIRDRFVIKSRNPQHKSRNSRITRLWKACSTFCRTKNNFQGMSIKVKKCLTSRLSVSMLEFLYQISVFSKMVQTLPVCVLYISRISCNSNKISQKVVQHQRLNLPP